MKGIWAIILAGGESSRMGSPKMILPYAGMTIIEKVLENILASDVEKVVTVLGSHKEEVLRVIEKYPVLQCYNSNFKNGMLSSVINKMINAYTESGKGIEVPVFENKRGHPLLVDKKYKDEIINLDEPDGLKCLLRRHPDDLLEVDTENPSVLMDIDTKEDYINEINKTSQTWKRQSGSN
jgi:molybdenum cofactor cytidylyltransferase